MAKRSIAAHRPYEYSRLSDEDGPQIRLFIIDPGEHNQKVRGQIEVARFDEDKGCVSLRSSQAPSGNNTLGEDFIEYDALSYAWGNPCDEVEIEILDTQRHVRTFMVSQKLEAALKILRDQSTSRIIWVDAICIDQSNQFERNHQVPLMDRVFGRARKVCVWLGPEHNSPSDLAMGNGESIKKAFDLLRKLLEDMNYEKTMKSAIADDLLALADLMRRDWFSRRWVIQEVTLSKKAKLFCGHEKMDWTKFAQAIHIFIDGERKTGKASNIVLRQKSVNYFSDNIDGTGAARLVDVFPKLHRPSSTSEQTPELLMGLEDLVCQLESFRTSKPHDTIYAYLALAKDTVPIAHLGANTSKLEIARRFIGSFQAKFKARPFRVDYREPYGNVCKEFIKFAVEQKADRSTALDVLCRPWAHDREDEGVDEEVDEDNDAINLPRWVSTLASARYAEKQDVEHGGYGLYRRNGDPLVGVEGRPIYQAAGGREVKSSLLRFKSFRPLNEQKSSLKRVHSLFVTGFVLDKISIIKDKVTTSAVVPEEWLRLGGWRNRTEEPPAELLRTLVADRGFAGGTMPLTYTTCCCRALKMSPSVRNLEPRTISNDVEHYRSEIADFCRRVEEVVVNRKLIKTEEDKRLGLVSGREVSSYTNPDRPDSIREGDLICILHGCSVPVVLRKKEKTKEDLVHEEAEYKEQTVICLQQKWRQIRSLRQERDRKHQTHRQKVLSFSLGTILITLILGRILPTPFLLLGNENRSWIESPLASMVSLLLNSSSSLSLELWASFLPSWSQIQLLLWPAGTNPQTPVIWFNTVTPLWQIVTSSAQQFVASADNSVWKPSEAFVTEFIIPPHGHQLLLLNMFSKHWGQSLSPFWPSWVSSRFLWQTLLLDFNYRQLFYCMGYVISFIAMVFGLRFSLRYLSRHLSRPSEEQKIKEKYPLDRTCYYEFWGACYIDGMMDGQAVELQNRTTPCNTTRQRILNEVFELR